MIFSRYFILILLVSAQFGTILTQYEPAPEEPETEATAEEATEAPAEEKGTEAPAEEETTAAGEEEKTTKAVDNETTEAVEEGETSTAPAKPTPTPTPAKCRACYRNTNGMCRTFTVACKKSGLNLRDKAGNIWKLSEGDCGNHKINEVKVCSSDCAHFKTANCQPTPTPICGYSANRGMCRKYPSLCHLKKNACNNPTIGDWRVANMARCNGLKVGARTVPC
ncbi:uncharacterized protein ACRADG_008728 [Cochliomyia hominivorax]